MDLKVRSLSAQIRQLSIWRLPNYLLEPRGSYLGEHNELIDRLNKIRSIVGLIILAGVAVYYSGLSHLASETGTPGGTNVPTVTAHSPEGNWFLGVIVTVVVAIFLVPAVSIFLVLWTRPKARKKALYQLRWPFIGIAAWFGIFATAVPIVAGAKALTSSVTRNMDVLAKLAAGILYAFVAIVVFVWLIKALYLAGTGLFRADDGHPLLAPITAPLVAWVSAGLMASQGGNGLVGVPATIGLITGFGGAISVTILSLITAYILKRQYKDKFPFRDGPPTEKADDDKETEEKDEKGGKEGGELDR
jgi:hypothetical protein